jgi:hypothetical protein
MLSFTCVSAFAQAQATGLGEQIAAELAQATPGVTPAAWLKSHADEKVDSFV